LLELFKNIDSKKENMREFKNICLELVGRDGEEKT
jgi:hypothetical protein